MGKSHSGSPPSSTHFAFDSSSAGGSSAAEEGGPRVRVGGGAAATSVAQKDDYFPIESYGVIGNLYTTSLICRETGSIDFMCYPFHSSPSVFCALLDRMKGGSYSISLAGGCEVTKQFYYPETNVLITRMYGKSESDGAIQITDFMPIDEGNISASKKLWLVRKVEVLSGSPMVSVTCNPRFDFGRVGCRISQMSNAYWGIETVEFEPFHTHSRAAVPLAKLFLVAPNFCKFATNATTLVATSEYTNSGHNGVSAVFQMTERQAPANFIFFGGESFFSGFYTPHPLLVPPASSGGGGGGGSGGGFNDTVNSNSNNSNNNGGSNNSNNNGGNAFYSSGSNNNNNLPRGSSTPVVTQVTGLPFSVHSLHSPAGPSGSVLPATSAATGSGGATKHVGDTTQWSLAAASIKEGCAKLFDATIRFWKDFSSKIACHLKDDNRKSHRRSSSSSHSSNTNGGGNRTHMYFNSILRSALLLKLLTFKPTGAIIAASTTSLPSVIGGQRNWDYRFCWVRDGSFISQAMMRVGLREEAFAFINFIHLHASLLNSDGALQPLYGIFGERNVSEYVIDHLEGYRSSAPVRVGNAASAQVQLDVYGEFIDCVFDYFCSDNRDGEGEVMEPELWQFVRKLTQQILRYCNNPDEGIWEIRAAPRHHTHSKVLCWVGLDRVIRMARAMALPLDNESLLIQSRDALWESVMQAGYNRDLGFVQSFHSRCLDASSLQFSLLSFVSATGEKNLKTLQQTLKSKENMGLIDGRGRMCLRYTSFDGLDGQEGSFNLCTYWLIQNLARSKQPSLQQEGKMMMEYMLSTVCNHLQLSSEMFSIATGRNLGNFPQAFSHVGIINAALDLSDYA